MFDNCLWQVYIMKKFLSLFLFAGYILLLITGCGANKGKIDNSLKKYFDSANVDGSFSMYDNSSGGVTVYNMKLDTQRFLPASTFKIVNSLIGLETGRIIDEKMIIPWDSVERWNKDWNQEL